ncbi:MAG: NAD-binding protein [Candidatus Latescibacterota bacterium]|nr:NAD-binding protein [Candidatus Latescibacterota bacterium]
MLRLIHIFLDSPRRRRNLKRLLRVLSLFALVVASFSLLFHVIMAREEQSFSVITGVYWTLTTMSTLGFGDITFVSDLGRIFSVIVLLTGTVFMLILLPFTFLQFFWTPFMEAQATARRPRDLAPDTSDHVVLTQHDPLSTALIERLDQYHYSYVLIEPDIEEATRLIDEGLNVIVGDLDDPDAYRRARVQDAALVVSAGKDEFNTQVASTVRGISEDTPIIGTADVPASIDILELAGCSHVLQLANMLGESMARRITAGDAMAHIIGSFDELFIAEATVARTPLVGKTLAEANLRRTVGISVVGIWERGQFFSARPETLITEHTVLVLAANEEQLYCYNSMFAIYNQSPEPVIIIGSGRVGRAAAHALAERNVDYRIVERSAEAAENMDGVILGSAAEIEVLKRAGIDHAPSVIITTRDDDTNIYLAIYCRQLRPDIQIITRANLERNVPNLHRAGTDFVMSYPSMGAREIANLLKRSSTVMIAEGLQVVRLPVPNCLVGESIAGSGIRRRTGCSVVAADMGGTTLVNPDPTKPLEKGGEMILIATAEGEREFLKEFGD